MAAIRWKKGQVSNEMQIWSGSQQAPGYSIRNGLAIIHTYQTKQQESSKDPSFLGQANSLTENLSLQSAFVKQNPIDIIELFCPKPVFLNYLGQK